MTPSTHRPQFGVALIVLMSACFATTDSTVKHLGASVPVLVLLWSRWMFQALAMGGVLAAKWHWPGAGGINLFRTRHPRFQFARAMLLLSNASLSFFGLQWLPLAEFTALAMLAPILSTLLASLVLRERVRAARWALVVLGFAGVLVIVRPGHGSLGWAVLLPLGSASTYAVFQVVTSRLAALEDPLTTHFYTGLSAALVLTLIVAASPVDIAPALSQAPLGAWALIAMIGLLGTLGQLCMLFAVTMAPISTLMPFAYVQIAFAAVIGTLVFHHAPEPAAVLGMVIIALGGAGSVWLNSRDARARHVADSVLTADPRGDGS